MAERQYPRKVWVLTPAFKVKEVEVTKPAWASLPVDYGDRTDAGRCYRLNEMFDTKEAAVAAGWDSIHRQEVDLEKRAERLNKKKAALSSAL